MSKKAKKIAPALVSTNKEGKITVIYKGNTHLCSTRSDAEALRDQFNAERLKEAA